MYIHIQITFNNTNKACFLLIKSLLAQVENNRFLIEKLSLIEFYMLRLYIVQINYLSVLVQLWFSYKKLLILPTHPKI